MTFCARFRGAGDDRLAAVDSRTDGGQPETLGHGVRDREERGTRRMEKGDKDSE